MNLKLMVVSAVVLFGLPALASGVDRRANRQEARIDQGVKSGELNGREARRLDARQDAIDAQIARDRADGPGLTPHERAKIQRRENELNRDIYKQKHDAQSR
jgi:hypothetical protein